jgi:chromosome partitioning protein
MKTPIVLLTNEKGGVGKTTTAVNLAAEFAQRARNVLLIDADFQANATNQVGAGERAAESGKYFAKAIAEQAPFTDYVVESNIPNIDVLAGSQELKNAHRQFAGKPRETHMFKAVLFPDGSRREIESRYDIVIIDTHPIVDQIVLSAGAIATGYIVPVFPEGPSVDGLTWLMREIREAGFQNPHLTLYGVLIGNHMPKNATYTKMIDQIRSFPQQIEGVRVFQTIIPHSASVAASNTMRLTALEYGGSKHLTLAFAALANEVWAVAQEHVRSINERITSVASDSSINPSIIEEVPELEVTNVAIIPITDDRVRASGDDQQEIIVVQEEIID